MEPIADRTGMIDLLHGGRASVIAVAVLELADGVALVDPGPTATIPVLRSSLESAGMTLGDVRALLVTHIHLDHAGAVA